MMIINSNFLWLTNNYMSTFLFAVKDTGPSFVHIAWDFPETVDELGYYKVSLVLTGHFKVSQDVNTQQSVTNQRKNTN